MEFNEENFKKLQHHYNTTVGLWATDKLPSSILHGIVNIPGLDLGSSQKDEIQDAINDVIKKYFFQIT